MPLKFSNWSISNWSITILISLTDIICPIRSKRVSTTVALLRSLSGKYPWERYEHLYLPSYGLNSTTTVLLGEWLWH